MSDRLVPFLCWDCGKAITSGVCADVLTDKSYRVLCDECADVAASLSGVPKSSK